ncbi:unnamed protein product [Closterium sp. NIES-54]
MKVTGILLFRVPRMAGSQPILLGSAMDVSHFSFFERSTAKEFILFACRTISRSAPYNQRQTVKEREYVVYVVNQSGLVVLVVADEAYPRGSGFAVCKKVAEEYMGAEGDAWMSIQQDNKKSVPLLDKLLVQAQDPANVDKIAKVQSEIDETKRAVETTIHKMLNRGETLENLASMSNDLSVQSKMFVKQAKDINNAYRARLSHALALAAPASRRPCCPIPSHCPWCPVAPAVLSRCVRPVPSHAPHLSVPPCRAVHPVPSCRVALSVRVALPVPSRRAAPAGLVRSRRGARPVTELTIEVLESALKDVERNLRSVASTFGAVPPPLFHGCTVPQLPTFTASLATAATDVTAVVVTTSSRTRGRSGRRDGQGAGGGGGGGVASGGGGSTEVGGATRAAASDSPAAAGGGDAQVRQAPAGPPAAGAGVAAWYLTQRQQQQHPLLSQQPQQTPGQGSGPRQPSCGAVHPPCTYLVQTGARRGLPCGRTHPPGQCFAKITDTLRAAYGVGGPAPEWLPLVQTYGLALWGMSASHLLDLLGTPHAMYVVVDSSASDSVYSSVVSLGASVGEVSIASVCTCVDTSLGAAPEDTSLSFALDCGASHCFFRDHTTLTPLPAPVSVALADPTSRPVTARYTTTFPCPADPLGFLTGFHVPSFSRNLVGVRPLVSSHVGMWIEPSIETAVCVDGDTYVPLATFTAEPGSGLYTLHTGPRGQQQQRHRQRQQQQRQWQQQHQQQKQQHH